MKRVSFSLRAYRLVGGVKSAASVDRVVTLTIQSSLVCGDINGDGWDRVTSMVVVTLVVVTLVVVTPLMLVGTRGGDNTGYARCEWLISPR